MIILATIVTLSCFGQTPRTFKYQAVARDASNQVLSNKTVNLKISIVADSENGTVVYSETHKPTTNVNGLLNLEIGAGTAVLGSFAGISWGTAAYYVKIEMDADGGENFKELGTSKLLAVPYALYAETSGGGNTTAKLKSGTVSQWTTLNDSTMNSDYAKVGIGVSDGIDRSLVVNNQIGLYGNTPGLLLKNTASGNKLWDISSNTNDLFVNETGVGTSLSFKTGGSVGIGTTTPDQSAKLDVTSTTQGFLLPRMTTDQRRAINAPAIGLQIYNLTTNCLNYYTPTGWVELCGSPVAVGPCNGVTSVTDIDANTYSTVEIGTQCWMRQNLKVTHYNDNSAIPNVTDNTDWSNLTTGAYCNRDNDPSYAETYGFLYNGYATTDIRNVCPQGWHVPTQDEWSTLVTYLGTESMAGGKLKETGTVHWGSQNVATNETGFTALPGNWRSIDGWFPHIEIVGMWWTSTPNQYQAGAIQYAQMNAANTYCGFAGGLKNLAYSIRCIKN